MSALGHFDRNCGMDMSKIGQSDPDQLYHRLKTGFDSGRPVGCDTL